MGAGVQDQYRSNKDQATVLNDTTLVVASSEALVIGLGELMKKEYSWRRDGFCSSWYQIREPVIDPTWFWNVFVLRQRLEISSTWFYVRTFSFERMELDG